VTYDSEQRLPHDPAGLLAEMGGIVSKLLLETRAKEWGVSLGQFVLALERSARKRFAEGGLTPERLGEYLQTLYIEDLVLATACLQSSEAAWEYFVQEYRGYLRAAAGAIMKGSRAGSDAQELADSLFAELFGLADGKRGERSLFRYFHGRSSLRTWLRAILAQRHVDKIRESKRWETLEDGDGKEPVALRPEPNSHAAADPHRGTYAARFSEALNACLGELEARDRKRLELYYAREITLAEIGREFGEHESSVSRNLERIRRELRVKAENYLQRVYSMSDAQVALCFQYAAEDALIDFRQLFPEKKSRETGARRREPS
jgi:RNA polymerase sigma factor (sigma-70 family)